MPADVIIDPSTGQIYWNDNTGTPQSISIKGDALNAISVTGYSASFSPGSSVGGTTTLVTFNDNSGTDALVPGTTGFNLGSSTLRWNTFSTNANLSGTLVVSDSTLSSSLLTGSVKFNGGIAISGNASIGQSLLLYGAGTAYTSYTGFKTGSVISNTLYTLPLTYPSTGTSVLQSDTSGVMSWVPLAATSSASGGTVSSGAQYQIAGYYSGTGASVSGSSTFTNNTSTGQVQILHTTASSSTATGALQVAGGVGISGKLTFNQAAFGTTGISSLPTMAMIGQTGDPIYMSVLEDNSISFEGSQGQLFSISPNLTTGYIWAVNDISGVPLLRSNVNGNSFIAEFGGNLGVGQTNPTYKLDLKGNFGLASSNDALYNFIFSNSAASGSNSLQIRSANSILFYNSGNSFYTGFKSTASADKIYVLPATDGSSGQFLQTDGAQNLSWATATGGAGSGSSGVNPGGQYQIGYYVATGASIDGSTSFTNNTATGVITIAHATGSTSTATGALIVSGGVGIGGSLFVGGIGASISGVTLSNSIITRGTWNGSIVSSVYGGTGLNLTGSSGVLTVSSGTVSASTTSSAIAAALTDESGSGSLVFNTSPSFGTGVTTGDATFAVFNTNATTINAFGAATIISLGASTGTATFNSTNNTTAANNGSVVFSGGVGIGKSVSIGGRLLLFNASAYTGFLSNQSAAGSTVYTLPASTPAIGSSVLQSDLTGVMSWVPMVVSSTGAGSGTVAIPDAQYRLAYYAGTGASVSSTSLITAVGTGVTITGATNASSNSVAALSILGGLGITGNAFIGGTVYAPSTSASNISNLIFNNGVVTSGSWSATAITSFYGGTGFNTYTTGDLLVGAGATLSKLAAGTQYFVLTSNGPTTVPSWQAVPPSAASSVAATATTSNQSFFITTVSASSITGVGLSTVVSFVINPFTGVVSLSGLAVTNSTASTSTSSGALIVTGGASVGQTLSVGGSLGIFNGSNYSAFRYTGTANTTYTLPASTPAIGASVLQSDLTGLMSWVPMVASSSGAGSGTVAIPDTQYRVAYYAGTGASVSSTSLITAVGTGVTISGATNATSTTVAALSVLGGLGITGNAFIGGTINVASSNTSVISGVSIANNVITSGSWSATAITSFYGGTGFNTYTNGDLLVGAGATLSKLAAGTQYYVLTSNGPSTIPSWQSVPPSAASSVAAIATTSNQSFFITAVSSSTITGVGLSTVVSFVVNPFTNIVTMSGLAVTSTTATTTSSSGALIVSGGASVGQTLSIGGSLNIFNGSNYSGFKFAGTANTTYTLPPRTPTGTGSSYLSSSIDGIMAWVPAPTGGSATPGGNNKQIQYNSSSSFAGASGFEYTAGGTAVTVGIFSPSGTGFTAGLWVNSIDGVTTRVGIGLSNPAYELEILGEISATNKSFVIDHPTKSGMKLRYGSLEGPENGVYVRGELKGTNIIEVPDHWVGLVYEDSYTVHLTPIGRFSHLYIEKIENYNVYIADNMMCPIHCYYSVWAERKDIPKLITEYEAQ